MCLLEKIRVWDFQAVISGLGRWYEVVSAVYLSDNGGQSFCSCSSVYNA